MKQKFNIKKFISVFWPKSVIRQWLCTYIKLVSVPILFIVVASLNLEWQATNNIKNSNRLVFERLIETSDNYLRQMQGSYQNVVFSRDLERVLGAEYPLTSDILQSLRSLNKTIQGDTYLKEFNKKGMYIILDNLQVVVKEGLISDIEEFARYSIENTFDAHERLMKRMKEIPTLQFIQSQIIVEETPIPVVAYVRHLPLTKAKKSNGTMIVYAGADELLASLTEVCNELNAQVYLVNQSMQVLATTDSSMEYLDIVALEGNDLNYNGNRFLKETFDSKITGLSYVTVIPYSTVTDNLMIQRVILGISLTLCIFVCLLLMRSGIRRSYSPVNQLLTSFGVDKIEDNEFDEIKKRWNYNTNRLVKLETEITNQRNSQKYNYFYRAIKDRRIDELDRQALREKYNMELISSAFVVLMMDIKSYGVFENKGDETNPHEEVLKFAMINVFEELSNEQHKGFMLLIDNYYVLIVNLNETRLDLWREDMQTLVNKARQVFKQHFKVEFQASCGDIHYYISGLKFAYQEAEEAIHFNTRFDEGVSFYKTYSAFQGNILTSENETHFTSKIKTGNFKETCEVIERIFNFENQNVSFDSIKMITFSLLNTMQKIAGEVLSGIPKELSAAVKEVLASRSTEEMKDIITKCSRLLCDEFKDRKVNKVSLKAKEYIIENYADPNLSLTSIAEHLNVHPAYLSGLFAENEGVGIVDFTHKIRVEHALELLKSTTLTIEQISTKVGYSSGKTFSRVFKKNIGSNPSENRG